MPGVKERQFYKDDYKTLYNSNKDSHRQDMGYNKGLHHEMKKHQEFNKVMNENQKKNKQREWTNFDQEFEEFLWDN